MKKVLIPTKLASIARETLTAHGGYEVIQDDSKELSKLALEHQDTHALIVRSEKVTAEIVDLFPNLKNRIDVPGGVLSGGEQQMLTICRSLMGCPKLMMIDEPTEGLSPQMVENVESLLKKIVEYLFETFLPESRDLKSSFFLRLTKLLFITRE